MSIQSEAEKRFSLPTYETFAFWVYVLGVAMTALGPIAHYIGWTFALISLVYGRIRYKTPLSIKLQPEGRKIFYFLVFFLLWSMFAHIPYVDSFYIWGKGASIPLEFLTGLYLAMRLIDTSKKRKIFGLAVVAVNLVFCFDVMFRPDFQILGWNGSLDNGNAVALYSLLTMPFFFCYAFWFFEKNIIIKYILCLTSLLFIIFSFSSGGWICAVMQIVIFMFYAAESKKLKILSVVILIAASIFIFSILISVFDNGPAVSLKRELNQMMSFNDFDTLTNSRTDTWKASIFMTKIHPFTGTGWATFEKVFNEQRNNMAGILHQEWSYPISHPHNMYLSILYSGGFPALLFFIVSFVLSTKKSWSGLRHDVINSGDIPWHLVCFILMVSMAIYGTNGDVFEARRDISVIFWACWGLLIVMPESDQNSDKGDKSEDPALC
ncbi:MAG: O-antigen ligase family protein [Negativicutes bacterium]|nr:O-antigen ligase family protein [Negativicutes bacterium]